VIAPGSRASHSRYTSIVTTLVISPHLDDAVLSLGASIAAWRARGERVVVASVYTTGPPLSEIPPEMHAFADYSARIAEDDAACRVLGVEVRRLDQIEHAFRKPYRRTYEYFDTPPTPTGFPALGGIVRAIATVAGDYDRIALPLGVGNHIDHVEAALAALDVFGPRVAFYEDFYAISELLRVRHPVTAPRTWCAEAAPLAQARRLADIMRTIAQRGTGPTLPELAGLAGPWHAEVTDVRAHERAQLAAVACYASQTRAFGGLLGIVRTICAYHAWWGGEPLWRADCSW
jgi:LmbE family N-acetylglucosaminyl deacetylase